MPQKNKGTKMTSPPEMSLYDMTMGFRATQLVYAAARLDLAALLAKGPRSVNDLARAVGAQPRALYRLMRGLTSLGLFVESEEGEFRLTAEGNRLRGDVPDSLRGLALLHGEDWYYRVYTELLYSVKTGQPAFRHRHGEPLFEYLHRHPEAAALFNEAMTSYSHEESPAILAAYDFSGAARVVDIGGGHGSLLATLLKAHPRMRGLLYELPEVIEGARHLLAREEVVDRCELLTGDFFESVPAGGDLYLLKSIIHDWDDDKSGVILANCRRAMAGGARLLLLERVVPPGNVPSEAKLFDINMLVVTGGLERTESEYRVLLERAGLRLERVLPTGCPMSIVEAVPF